jgi:glycerate kinase
MVSTPTIVLAPDSFKESLSSAEICACLKTGIHKVDPDINVVSSPIADGGEGTLEALLVVPGSRKVKTNVLGPMGKIVPSEWLFIEERETAVIEMALAAGLPMVPEDQRNPMQATTYGVGELINEAIAFGSKHIIVGIGGSATNDGGAGMLQALGFRLMDVKGEPIEKGNKGLSEIHSIDTDKVDKRIFSASYLVASDVQNPLCGPDGASFVYGPQKGASPGKVMEMDTNMNHFSKVVRDWKGKDLSSTPGAGAAGGLGFAFMAFLDARLQSGFELIADITGLESSIKSADWILTGEGKLDLQTLQGKGPFGVAQMVRKYNQRTIAVGGILDPEAREQLDKVFDKTFIISPDGTSREESIRNAANFMIETGERIARYVTNV